MVRAQSFVNAAACRAVSNTAWRRIIRKYHVSPLLVLGHYFDVVSLGKDFQPRVLHLTQVKMSTW